MQRKEESNLRATGCRGEVKLNNFIPLLPDLEAANQSILRVTMCT